MLPFPFSWSFKEFPNEKVVMGFAGKIPQMYIHVSNMQSE